MKRIIQIVITVVLISITHVLSAQVVDGITYQAVALDQNGKEIPGIDAKGNVIQEKQLAVRFTIIEASVDGSIVYQENHNTNTDINGLFSLVIGHGEISTISPNTSILDINWGANKHYLKVEIDIKGFGVYKTMGIQQLLAVPYALHALNTNYENIANAPVIPENLSDLNNDMGFITSPEDGDSDPTNELQALSISNDTIYLSSGGYVVLPVGFSGDYNDLVNQPTIPAAADGSETIILAGTNVSVTGAGTSANPYVLEASGNINGTAAGQMQYWNGSAWVIVSPGTTGQTLTYCNGVPTWGPCLDLLPILTTAEVSAISYSSAICGGNITADGGSPVTSRGVCWSTLPNPLATGSHTTDGAGTGSFSSSITGLTANTTYYVRAYATNAVGTTYGDERSFTTATILETEVVDVTNPSTGKIWMDRNLGASQVATSSTDALSYGDLYQWGRAADGHQIRTSATTSTLSTTNTPGHGKFITNSFSPYDWRNPQNDNLWQGVSGTNNPCPSGYRLPTEAELNSERSSWSTNNAAGAFASPLKLPLAGSRDGINGSLYGVGSYGDYWSSTVDGANSRDLYFDSSDANMNSYYRSYGASVRCLKNLDSPSAPELTTNTVIDITATTATSGGNVTADGGSPVTSRGICWSTSANPTTANSSVASGSGTGSFTASMTGLSSSTTYYVRAYATNSVGTTYGNQVSFTTATILETEVVDVTNPTTGKIWMDRNLGASQVATSSTDALSYGDLYQWGRAADGHQIRTSATTSTLSTTNTPGHGKFIIPSSNPYDWRNPQNDNLWQGVSGTNNPCPSGYRLPTEAELNSERLSWSSNNVAGAFASPLKLPVAGYRDNSDGSLSNVGSDGFFWSSTVDGTFSRLLFFNSSSAFMNSSIRAYGLSVRCLKD